MQKQLFTNAHDGRWRGWDDDQLHIGECRLILTDTVADVSNIIYSTIQKKEYQALYCIEGVDPQI